MKHVKLALSIGKFISYARKLLDDFHEELQPCFCTDSGQKSAMCGRISTSIELLDKTSLPDFIDHRIVNHCLIDSQR